MPFLLEEKFEMMKAIRDELFHFKQSPLYEYRMQNKYYPVVGEGSHSAKVMFIGEAPGKNEAETARPFCGKSGKVLDAMLESIELNRSDVYITNIVKDRPPENRDPTPEEIKLYAPFLDRQIDIIKKTQKGLEVYLASAKALIWRNEQFSSLFFIGKAHVILPGVICL